MAVLVHGSGPNDRDQSIPVSGVLTLKPFAELAQGLQEQGIAVLRYDKRSYTLTQRPGGPTPEEMNSIQVDDFIQDAQAAINYVQGLPEVDPTQVILIGHSQGAGLVPLIAEGQELIGAVAIAPNMMGIMDQVLYQLEYQIELMKKMNGSGLYDQHIQTAQGQQAMFKDQFAKLKDGTIAPEQNLMGAPGGFWLRWEELSQNTPQQLVDLEIPLLLMNGTQDFKCPVHLVEEKEDLFSDKADLKLVYLKDVGHEMYNNQTQAFAPEIPVQIAEWFQRLE